MIFLVIARRLVLAISIAAATSSTMVMHTLRSPATSTRLFGSSFLNSGVGTLADVG
jgi:hypothetical protein